MKKKDKLIIIISTIILLLILLIIPFTYEKKLTHSSRLIDTFIDISKNNKSGFNLKNEEFLSNGVVNLVYYSDDLGETSSYFVDRKTGKILDYYSIIKPKFHESFDEKEEELLHLKYPDFVVEGILNSGKKSVEVFPNKLVVHYYDVVTSPQVTDKLDLTINNNEISKYLSIDFELDDEYQNESGYDYDPTKKYIAFTFDDGPSRKNTNDIVNYLNSNKSRATFFMVGNFMVKNTDIVKNVYDNKMEIGSHSYAHSNLNKQKIDKITEEMQKTDQIYYDITGDNFKLLRPPYGSINDTVKETFGYSYIIWSLDTNDWRYKDPDYIFNFVTEHVKDGDIVLMHDIHETTKIAVERLLPELYVRGYRIVTVSELANYKGVTLEPHVSYRGFN